MAGPLNLGNYEISANEAEDELVIEHSLTGKRTTISEDEFTTGEVHSEVDNNNIYTANVDGSDLGQKVQNAVNALPNGKGRVRITPKDDGTPWTWSTDIVIDLLANEGVHIDIDNNVRIEYTGDGFPLTFDSPNGPNYREQQESVGKLEGGYWKATTGDPSGWLRVKDSFNSQIYPQQVEFHNSTNDAVGVSLENHEQFTEKSHIGGKYFTDIGLDSKPPSVTGGTGTDSFHNTYLDAPHFNFENIGIRLRGNWAMSHATQPSMFPKADGATCLVLGTTKASGFTIVSAKFEDSTGGSYANTLGIEATPEYEWTLPPLLVNPELSSLSTNATFQEAWHDITFIKTVYGELTVTDINETNTVAFNLSASGGELTFKDNDGKVKADDGRTVLDMGNSRIELEKTARKPQDVRGNVPENGKGAEAYHDPSINGDSNTEGPAFYDGSEWVSQVDGSVIS